MKSPLATLIRSNRTFFAVAMLCVLVAKGFAFLGMASAIGKYQDASRHYFTAAVLGSHCDHDRDNDLPQGGQAHQTNCCILCSGATRDASLVDPTLTGEVIALLTPRAETLKITFASFRGDPPRAEATGLFSGWSPTAPPVV